MLKVILFALMLSHPTQQGYGSPIILRNIGVDKELLEYTQVALNLTKRFIKPHTNTLVIMEKCEYFCREQQLVHMTLVDNFLRNIDLNLNVQLFLGEPNERLWDYNLFVVDNWWAFEFLRFRMPVTQKDREFYFFVLLTNPTPDYDSHMTMIFRMCQKIRVKNVVIMHRAEKNQSVINFYTYHAFSAQHCQDQITIHEFNRYENGQLQKDFLFPDLSNFHGCTLIVNGHVVEPLLTFDGDSENVEHLRDVSRIGGIEGEILKLVAKAINMKLVFRIRREINNLRMNLTRDLTQGQAEISIGGLSPILPDADKFTYSFVYHTTPWVFVVKEGLLFGPIKQLLRPLKEDTWLVILFLWLFIGAVVEILKCVRKSTWRNFLFGPHNKYPIHHMMVTLLGYPLSTAVLPTRNFARFLLMSWLLLTFELRNAYQGKMFDSLRLAKRLPVPATIAELIKGDYTLLAPVFSDFYPANKTRIVKTTAIRLHELNASEKRLTSMVLLDYLMHYNDKNRHNSSLTYVEEYVYFFQSAMFFRKHSMLFASFNRKLKLLSDAGITAHIALRHVRWRKRYRSPSTEVGEITNRNLRGLYTIYGLLCWIAVFLFALELLTKKLRSLKYIMDWLH